MQNTNDAYNDIKRSLLAFCKNFLNRYDINEAQVWDFDAHATLQELPAKPLVGVGDYTITNNSDKHIASCMFVITTSSDDANLKLMSKIVGLMYSDLDPGRQSSELEVIDENGLRRGYMTPLEGVSVSPVGINETRPVQMISVSFAVGYSHLPA